ncbi:RxLR-like protein [Plasmopara halstedii]|uniref:RxLR-like protein n=1 Tax=Plasmopara halstedii TaxID=4781 RepID=A0A0P1B3I2_PLAHL|nr:RxLR-like protein [Plasmopara halstedii]CEG49295.1 RxLR-like protein [Plasmopara halstedii]|eukprot:XP_024585664.1 RxLR-like protein [Plasmopara halstedii]
MKLNDALFVLASLLLFNVDIVFATRNTTAILLESAPLEPENLRTKTDNHGTGKENEDEDRMMSVLDNAAHATEISTESVQPKITLLGVFKDFGLEPFLLSPTLTPEDAIELLSSDNYMFWCVIMKPFGDENLTPDQIVLRHLSELFQGKEVLLIVWGLHQKESVKAKRNAEKLKLALFKDMRHSKKITTYNDFIAKVWPKHLSTVKRRRGDPTA